MRFYWLGHEIQEDFENRRKNVLIEGVNKLEPLFQSKTEISDLELAIRFAESDTLDIGLKFNYENKTIESEKVLVINYPNAFTLALYSYITAPNGLVFGIHFNQEIFEKVNAELKELANSFMFKHDSINEKYFVLKDSPNSMQFYLPWERRRRGKRNSAEERGSFVNTYIIYTDWKEHIRYPEISEVYDKIIIFPNDYYACSNMQEHLKLGGKLAYIETKILEEQKTSLLGIVTKTANDFLVENTDLKLRTGYDFKNKK